MLRDLRCNVRAHAKQTTRLEQRPSYAYLILDAVDKKASDDVFLGGVGERRSRKGPEDEAGSASGPESWRAS